MCKKLKLSTNSQDLNLKTFKHVHCPECKSLVGYYKHQLKNYKGSKYFDCPICSKDVNVESLES